MKKVLTPERMGEADRAAIASGIPSFSLMTRAGREVGRAAVRVMGGIYGRRVVIICGKGNNGGDGLVAASYLTKLGALCRVDTIEDPDAMKGDARRALDLFGVEQTRRFVPSNLERELERADLVIDAIMGTGFKGTLSGPAAEAVGLIESAGIPVVSVDIPSGVDGRTGRVEGPAVRADVTVTFGALKPGLLLQPGIQHAGAVEVVDIGIPTELLAEDLQLVEPSDVAELLPPRPLGAHKRSVGKVLVVAGHPGMAGAAALAALGALRTGAGLVRTAVPESIAAGLDVAILESLTVALPENREGGLRQEAVDQVLELAAQANVLAVGPGLSRDEETLKCVHRILDEVDIPIVLDAEGVNAFAGRAQDLRTRKAPTVLTPHSGELSRLLGTTATQIDGDRVSAALEGARVTGATLLLKGFGTVVANPQGEAVLVGRGGPVLATGGTGDVLTGVIAALATSNDPFKAAWGGAYLHGAAGEVLAESVGDRGVIAGDLLDVIPHVIAAVRS